MKEWFKEWGIFLMVMILIVCFGFVYIITPFSQANKKYQEKIEKGWYEATIIVDGVEIVRGQIEDIRKSRNFVTVTIANQEFTTSYNNILIVYYPYD